MTAGVCYGAGEEDGVHCGLVGPYIASQGRFDGCQRISSTAAVDKIGEPPLCSLQRDASRLSTASGLADGRGTAQGGSWRAEMVWAVLAAAETVTGAGGLRGRRGKAAVLVSDAGRALALRSGQQRSG